MPFVSLERADLSDLVYHELDPAVGYARLEIVVQKDGDLRIGTLVFREKNASVLAPYAEVTGAADLSLDNEYAVVFGDNYGCKETWTVTAADTEINSVGFVSGPIFLKDKFILENLAAAGFTPTDAQYATIKQLLQNQGIVFEKTL